MTEKCFDIGEIQAFLDGELAAEQSEFVARHVAVCDDCAILLAEAEEDTAFAFSALEGEFNTLVPTKRLWAKINDSIEREKKSFWKPVFAFLLKPSTAAFAGLLFVAVVSVSLLILKPENSSPNVAAINDKKTVAAPIVAPSSINDSTPDKIPTPAIIRSNVRAANDNSDKNEFRAVKASAVKIERTAEDVKPITRTETVVPVSSRESVRGEETYLKTIATLTATVNERKDQTLSASSRFAFERDLAVTNEAIKQMKREVEKNPNNDAAKQILRASYQNKIDLLNTVADKTELMASLK